MTAPGAPCRTAARQQGQALVLGMLLMGTAILVFIRYFDTGQVVAAKSRQLHSLDAAAYSGALVQARALNMLAYINRAHVGHQVAMAHLVTLGSWASLGGAEARQLMIGDPPRLRRGHDVRPGTWRGLCGRSAGGRLRTSVRQRRHACPRLFGS